MEEINLTIRELLVFEAIVRNFILTAEPTGSRFLSKQRICDLSSASIRNIMVDLEEKGLITQPHTSAGRIPTDKGYRVYVDQLMQHDHLSDTVQKQIRQDLEVVEQSDLHIVMEATSRALSRATHQLGFVLSPRLSKGIFKHIHIYPISYQRYCINITIDSGFVKTMQLELETNIKSTSIDTVCQIINERFYGRSLEEIFPLQETVFSDVEPFHLGVIKLFIPSIHMMLQRDKESEIYTEGQTNILLNPEFNSPQNLQSIIEILEEKKLLLHLFGQRLQTTKRVLITIGGEIEEGKFSSLSVVQTAYKLGNMEGYLGVVGPKRMPYGFLVSAVEYTSKLLDELYS